MPRIRSLTRAIMPAALLFTVIALFVQAYRPSVYTQIIQDSVNAPDGGFFDRTLTCPSGYVATGAGYSQGNVEFSANEPTDDGQGWHFNFAAGQNGYATMKVVCASQ